MKESWVMVICCLIFMDVAKGEDVYLTLPRNLVIGAGTASYQIEGAWNAGGKGVNVWDWFTHNYPASILDRSNGDIACNSYYRYKEDVQFIKSLGLGAYRFSISWSRILPTGFTNKINEEGLQYYKNLTAELIANGIEPIVTLYHWDHPQIIEDMGGWLNELIVDWFVAYANVIFEALGNSVKIWITINEPQSFCEFSYEGSDLMQFAPGKRLYGIGKYICGHNVLKAHAKTYHLYNDKFRRTQRGQIGLLQACHGYLASDNNDTVVADTAYQFNCGWLAHPIYVGDYPKIMKTRIATVSKRQGYPTSRLPKFSEEWISTIKGTSDYFGLNHYTTWLVSSDPDEKQGIYNTDSGLIIGQNHNWPISSAWWQSIYAPGFGDLLRKIRDEYNNPPLRVMENGYADGGEIEDYGRISYHHDYVKELIIAKERDGCNIKSYCMWSLMDNFEWNSGYTQKFGIIGVDFNDPERTRTIKLSALWWRRVLATRKLQPIHTNSEKNCSSTNS